MLGLSVAGQAQNEGCPVITTACVDALHAQAIANSQELRVLEQAIKLQNAKLWTAYLSANALNPLSLGLQLIRNAAGGGERAERKLTIAQLELRRASLIAELRARIVAELTAYAQADAESKRAAQALATHTARVKLLEISYGAGDGETVNMLREWQRTDELRAAVSRAGELRAAAVVRLRQIVGVAD